MTPHRLVVAAIALWLASLSSVRGDELRYYERNGITYCEVRRSPAPQYAQYPPTAARQNPRTSYCEQITSENRPMVRTWWTPVTEYQWESHWVDRWNPFAEPHLELRMVPRTRWLERSEVVSMPMTCRRLVPASEAAPAMARRNDSLESVARIPVSGLPTAAPSRSGSASRVAQLIPYGGVSRLDNQPPRYPQDASQK